MARILLQNLRKTYDETEAVSGINLDIEHNEFVVLVGPSGCGKTTTLRMIAGLEEITGGEIFIGDRLINNVPPKDRDIAMVFQNYALYPHMTVEQNMSFGLRLRKFSQAEIEQRVKHAADILNIGELLARRPKQLSGGQRQRVAMGRAIVRNPEAFLFDEPLSNLDAKLRVQMRTEIKKIHRRVQTTVVYVTHDQVEAMTLADRIVVMNHGLIEQVASPQEMYEAPKTRFVAGFIGSPAMNFVPCKVVQRGAGLGVRLSEDITLDLPAEQSRRYRDYLGRDMVFGIRPEHLTEQRQHTNEQQLDFSCIVEVLEPMGVDTMVFMAIEGVEVTARAAPKSVVNPGEIMMFTIDMNNMHLIDPGTDRVV
ncbi:MAG: sn-glycerol-3-phosphate ABC transporter ATP-binding protein UgpC [Alphaproteobacteria bacterium]|nr:sn-glycerol-3-phosphate ABC transporter ATP-binding protein UgpC [Alphaproteobacteria bacterium]